MFLEADVRRDPPDRSVDEDAERLEHGQRAENQQRRGSDVANDFRADPVRDPHPDARAEERLNTR